MAALPALINSSLRPSKLSTTILELNCQCRLIIISVRYQMFGRPLIHPFHSVIVDRGDMLNSLADTGNKVVGALRQLRGRFRRNDLADYGE